MITKVNFPLFYPGYLGDAKSNVVLLMYANISGLKLYERKSLCGNYKSLPFKGREAGIKCTVFIFTFKMNKKK